MTRLLPIFISGLCIFACATTGNPIVSTAPPPAEDLQSEPVDEAQQNASSTQTSEETEIHVVKLPPIEQSQTPIAASNANGLVCRREMRTGTHRAVRVCRTRAEMMRLEKESKDTFKELHRSQMQGK